MSRFSRIRKPSASAVWSNIKRALRTAFVPPEDHDDRNTYFLYAEIIFAALLSSAASYNSAFIIRLGGSNTLVGLLSSLPALVAVLLFLPSAQLLDGVRNVKSWVVRTIFLARLPYLLLPLLPWLFPSHAAVAAVAVLVAGQVPSVLFSTAWSPLLADVIPRKSRSSVISWRNILNSGTVALGIYLAGLWLDSHTFPGNYQWMYLGGALLGGVSTFLVSRIQTVPQTADTTNTGKRSSLWKNVRKVVIENQGFSRIIFDTLFFNLGAWMIGPLLTIFYVKQLGASDGWIGINGMISNIGILIGYFAWQRVLHKLGDNRTLLIAAPLMCLQPLLIALWPNLTFILGVSLLINLLVPGVNLSHAVIWFDLMPKDTKYAATALYSMAMNIGAFLGPLLGVWLADQLGLVTTIVIGGVMRLLGSGMFYLFPLKPQETEPLEA